MSDPKPIRFLRWLTATQPIRIVFIHLVIGLLIWSLITDRPESPWDIIGWVVTAMPLVGYWAGNYWYWSVKLDKGAKC